MKWEEFFGALLEMSGQSISVVAHDSAADRLINDISVSEVTTASPLEKINEVIDTTATKTGLKRWHVIAAVVGKSKLKSSEKNPKQASISRQPRLCFMYQKTSFLRLVWQPMTLRWRTLGRSICL